MQVSRRVFTAGALSAAASFRFASPAFGQGTPKFDGAIAAISAHAEQHLRYFGLPGMTLGLTTPSGFNTVLNFGFANRDSQARITPDTLFQIGSISKSMTANVIHQLAAEGRLRLTDRVSAILPTLHLPAAITVQHLLDHTAGLPDDAPLFPDGGLLAAYAPGAHWHYSNTGYHILGEIAAKVGGKPLDRLLTERIFAPLGMRRSRGAIIGPDRPLYAQGYEMADMTAPFVRGVPLAPAAWVDVTFGAGCVASTADDMLRWMRSLAGAAQGRGGLGLGAAQAKAFTSHFVATDSPALTYGNGFMHVGGEGKPFLHHTGGMVSFASAFHLDTQTGIGAFASSNITAFAEYRPRLLTMYAVGALAAADVGRPIPPPPALAATLSNAADFVGRYRGPAGAFEVKAGSPLTIVANGQEAALQWTGDNFFRTLHPDFHAFTLQFEGKAPAINGASWGANSYVRDGTSGTLPRSDRVLEPFAGRYINDSPWWGMVRVVERAGKLWLGTETPTTRIAPYLWRIGDESWSPERMSFADYIGGRPQTLIFSGEKFVRHDI